MPASSGTRRGNGSGWGGAARGEGNREAGPGRPEGVKNGEGRAARAREALAEAAPLAVQTIIDLAADKADPRALQAAVAILNRVGMHEKSGIEIGGDGGGPLKVEVAIVRHQASDTGTV
jgi:hypothetical protein